MNQKPLNLGRSASASAIRTVTVGGGLTVADILLFAGTLSLWTSTSLSHSAIAHFLLWTGAIAFLWGTNTWSICCFTAAGHFGVKFVYVDLKILVILFIGIC